MTVPDGTKKQLLLGTSAFGTPYAGKRTGWDQPALLQSALTLKLP
ncbi:hypothetical protein GCM10020256_56480 [Streptomyces thermocoprophilus]